MKKVKWCFSIKGGLKMTEPNKEVSLSYLNEAERTLSKIKGLIDGEDFVWASVRIYYCAYYSLYAFLQRIGVKSENHDCSIELARELLNRGLKEMEEFKQDRIKFQYYLKTGQKSGLNRAYSQAKGFYLSFKKFVVELNNKDIEDYRNKLKEILNE